MEINLVLYFFLYILLCSIVLFVFLYIYFTLVFYNYWRRRNVPTLQPSFPFGNLEPIFRARKSLNVTIWEIYKKVKGPFAGLYLLNKPGLIIKVTKYYLLSTIFIFVNFSWLVIQLYSRHDRCIKDLKQNFNRMRHIDSFCKHF